jgi:signal peptidase II
MQTTDTPQTTTNGSTLTRRGAFLRAVIVLVVVVGLDQLTKHTVATSIAPGEQQKFLPGIQLVHVRNTGVAFGLFSSGGVLVLTLTLLALALLLAYFLVRPTRPWLWLPTGMLIGGAVGNLIDRAAFGSVIDFIKLPAWPAFNVADISITFGVLALLWVLEGRGGEGRPARRRAERLRAR